MQLEDFFLSSSLADFACLSMTDLTLYQRCACKLFTYIRKSEIRKFLGSFRYHNPKISYLHQPAKSTSAIFYG
jgi:hypothetical protein